MIFVAPVVLSVSLIEVVRLIADVATVLVAAFSLFVSCSMLKTTQKQVNESASIQYKRDLAGLFLCLQDAMYNVERFSEIMSPFTEDAGSLAKRQISDVEDKIINVLSPVRLDENSSFVIHTMRDKLSKLEEYELMAVSLLEQQQRIGKDNAKIVSCFIHTYRLFIIAVWGKRCCTAALCNSVKKCREDNINIYPLGNCEKSIYGLFMDLDKLKNAVTSGKILDKIGNVLYG